MLICAPAQWLPSTDETVDRQALLVTVATSWEFLRLPAYVNNFSVTSIGEVSDHGPILQRCQAVFVEAPA